MIDARTREQAVLVALAAATLAGATYGTPEIAAMLGTSLGLYWGALLDRGPE